MEWTTAASSLAEAPDHQSLVTDFGYAIGELSDTITQLRSRLSPVFAPEDDAKVPGTPQAAPPSVSPHRDQLHSINAATAELRWILNRLEI